MKALISIHDVMPQTLNSVRELIDLLPAPCRDKLTLLVVPGLDWQADQIRQLKEWQDTGYILAGHGWRHTCGQDKTFYHRLHAAILSRNAAEHLSLDTEELAALLVRNHNWFGQQDLASPDFYVPPAWAMGALGRARLRELPFRYYETTSGIYDSERDLHRHLPLTGFQADTLWRRCSLAGWNAMNRAMATASRPLRISIHPDDHRLQLRRSLFHYLNLVTETVDYRLDP